MDFGREEVIAEWVCVLVVGVGVFVEWSGGGGGEDCVSVCVGGAAGAGGGEDFEAPSDRERCSPTCFFWNRRY